MTTQPIQQSDEFLSEAEVEQRFGIPRRTLQAWRFQKRVLPFHKISRMVRYRASDIESHLEKHRVTVTA